MATGAITASDKRVVAQKVGRHLVAVYGKRKSYPPKVVRASMRRCGFPDVWDCWALSLFCSPGEFETWHAALGETCDYATMHADMLGAIDLSGAMDFFSFDWLDAAVDAAGDGLSHP